MNKNRIALGIALSILVLFSSCKDKQRVVPITSIPSEACCILYEYFDSGFINVQGYTLNEIDFVQTQEITPYQETVFEILTQEILVSTSPTILPAPSPYVETETPHEDTRPVNITPRPIASTTVPQPTIRTTVASNQTVTNTQLLYRVQIGSFNNIANAQRNFNQLKSAGFNPVLEQSGNYTRVVIPHVEAQNLTAMVNRLNNAGFTETWIRNEL